MDKLQRRPDWMWLWNHDLDHILNHIFDQIFKTWSVKIFTVFNSLLKKLGPMHRAQIHIYQIVQ